MRGQSNDIMDMVWKKFRETTRREKKKERREKTQNGDEVKNKKQENRKIRIKR